MSKIIKSESHIIYCPRNKKTGKFVTERYELTDDIFEAIGWETRELCKNDINDMDEPNEWEVVEKITTMIIKK